ncbi:MAG: HDOD domain-containing protein [Rhodothermales bacterium]
MQAITGAIPSPPLLAFKVLKLARQEPLDFGAISRIIATDASLSSTLMKYANSSRNGLRRPITDLARALVTLGRDAVIDIVMIDAMRSLKAASRVTWPGGDEGFWKHSVAVAIAARYLASRTGMPYPEEAFTCGLLHDFGKLVMLHHSGAAYGQLLVESATADKPLFKLEQQRIGHTHANIGAIVGRQWRLPDSLIHAIEQHHEKPDVVFGTLGNLVRSANLLVKIAGIGHSGSPYVLVDSYRRMPHARLTAPDLIEMIVQLPGKVGELAAYILGGSGEKKPAQDPGAERPRVYVDIVSEDEAALVRYVLIGLGYTPSLPGGDPAQSEEDGIETSYAAVISDHVEACTVVGPMIDYAPRIADKQRVDLQANIEELRAWLLEHIAEACPS